MKKSLEFIIFIEIWGLIDLSFSGQKFTWSNKRVIAHRIWKRLDVDLVNDIWLESMQKITITHLSTTSLDNCSLLFEIISQDTIYTMYFKILNSGLIILFFDQYEVMFGEVYGR